MLEPIKFKAIEAAVRTLTNLGCELKVICPGGSEYGALEVVRKSTRINVNSFVQTGYREAISVMEPGGTVTIPWPDDASIENLRSAMVSRCIRDFGKGSAISEIVLNNDSPGSGGVTVLRIL